MSATLEAGRSAQPKREPGPGLKRKLQIDEECAALDVVRTRTWDRLGFDHRTRAPYVNPDRKQRKALAAERKRTRKARASGLWAGE